MAAQPQPQLPRGWAHPQLVFFDKVPLGLCRLWSKDMLSGVQHLHSNSVVHRDIKPSNLLLQMDPESGIMRLKLADFGASRSLTSLSPSSNEAALTPGRCTVMYSAPEMWTGHYGFPVDMWSAGAVVGEIVLGSIVFSSGACMIAKMCERLGSPNGDELAALGKVVRAALLDKKAFAGQSLSRPAIVAAAAVRGERGAAIGRTLVALGPEVATRRVFCCRSFMVDGPSSHTGRRTCGGQAQGGGQG